jgi:hypothetical protein
LRALPPCLKKISTPRNAFTQRPLSKKRRELQYTPRSIYRRLRREKLFPHFARFATVSEKNLYTQEHFQAKTAKKTKSQSPIHAAFAARNYLAPSPPLPEKT